MKTINVLIFILRIGAGIALLSMVFLTCADVVGGLFDHPILGSEEIVGLLGTLLLAFALPITHREKGHIGVDLVYRLMPDKVKWGLDVGIALVCTIFFGLAAWQSYLYAGTMKRVGQVSTTIQFPIHYVIDCMFLGTLVLAIVIFAEFINTLRGKTDE
jgi:TRAP-type C4-dicarboxylate transport system permease small subunit